MTSGADAGDALSSLVEQTFENIKSQAPAFEELHKQAIKYQALMEQAAEAQSVFVDHLSRVAVAAARSRGDTARLGQDLQHIVHGHKELSTRRREQAFKLNTQFVAPLGKRLKADARALGKMEEDFKSMSKSLRADLKKALGQATKAQKAALKSGSTAQPQLEQATHACDQRARSYEEFNQRFLRTVLIEERRRYCYLIDNYASVFATDFAPELQQAVLGVLRLCEDPEDLPDEGLELIRSNSSSIKQPAPTTQSAPLPRYIPRGGVAIDMLRAQQGAASSEY